MSIFEDDRVLEKMVYWLVVILAAESLEIDQTDAEQRLLSFLSGTQDPSKSTFHTRDKSG